MCRTRKLTRLDSSTLLPQFRDLLDAKDYDALFEGSTINRQYWMYEVKAALAATASSQARRKRKHSHVSQHPLTLLLLLLLNTVTGYRQLQLLLNAAINNSSLLYNMPLRIQTNVTNNLASHSSSPHLSHPTGPSHLLTLLLA